MRLNLRPLASASIIYFVVFLQIPAAFSVDLNPLHKDSEPRKDLRKTDPTNVKIKHSTVFHGGGRIITDLVDLPTSAKYVLQVPRHKFDGWFLDFDDKAESKKDGKWTSARNVMLTQQDGVKWKAIRTKDAYKLAIQAPNHKFNGWYLDFDGHAKVIPDSKWTSSQNILLTEEGGAEWWASKEKSGVKFILHAPNDKFDGWYLDFDGQAKESNTGKWTSAHNIVLTKENPAVWKTVTD